MAPYLTLVEDRVCGTEVITIEHENKRVLYRVLAVVIT